MLYYPVFGIPIFSSTMNKSRFELIAARMPFCSNSRRANLRIQNDKFAPIRDLFTSFTSNIRKFYKPYENVTIDEQLVPFRGRVTFRQYIPSKPAKYHIILWLLCDSSTNFVLDADVYLGKGSLPNTNTSVAEQVVKVMMDHFYYPGINLTTHNFFSSIPIAKYLYKMNITFVGTIRKNKKPTSRPPKTEEI